MARGYIIAAGHPLTGEAAEHALRCGGNAIDAACSGWLAACLAEPVLTSPGGGGFAMVAPASGKPRLYDFFAQTPRRINPEAALHPLEADFGSTRQVFHLGHGSVATPGCVAGILRMHADLGRLPLRECAAPALELSRSGLTVTEHAATLLDVVRALYRSTPESAALFSSPSRPDACLREGETFSNPAFETFLEMLVAEGSRWFYEGDIGRIIGDYCQQHNGHLSRDDFVHYRVALREPLMIRRNGATVFLNPPPSMGGTLIAVGLLSRGTPQHCAYPFENRDAWMEWIDPLRLMSLMRSREGHAGLTGADRERIRSTLASAPEVGDALDTLFPGAFDHRQATGTTHISVIDEEGNEVSMTTSNGAGSAVIPRGTGFMLNNMLGEEDLQPGGLGTWEPDRRLASMMAPTLAVLGDGRRVATGSGGSNRIRSTILQILRHLIDREAGIGEAVRAPRLHWESDQVHAESGAAEVLPGSLPWPVILHDVPNLFFGGANSVACDRSGRFTGVADPRRGGVVLSG